LLHVQIKTGGGAKCNCAQLTLSLMGRRCRAAMRCGSGARAHPRTAPVFLHLLLPPCGKERAVGLRRFGGHR
jgi:hypothetical protein